MSTTDDPGEGDPRVALAELRQLHARLCTTAAALRSTLAPLAARWTGEMTGLEGETEGFPEAERVALYESVCADLRMLEALTAKLERLSDQLDPRDPASFPQ